MLLSDALPSAVDDGYEEQATTAQASPPVAGEQATTTAAPPPVASEQEAVEVIEVPGVPDAASSDEAATATSPPVEAVEVIEVPGVPDAASSDEAAAAKTSPPIANEAVKTIAVPNVPDVVFDEDDDADAAMPGCMRYIINCFILPMTIGGLNGFIWSAASLYFRLNGWPLWSLGLATFTGFAVRLLVTQILMKFGFWTCLPGAVLCLLFLVPVILDQSQEWAVVLQVVAVTTFEPNLANDAIVFYNFSASESQAQRAVSQNLQCKTVWYALASTIGGVIYDYSGWPGIVVYHVALQSLQTLLFITEPAVWGSFAEFRQKWGRCGKKDEEDWGPDDVVSVVPTGPKEAWSGPPSPPTAAMLVLPGQPDVGRGSMVSVVSVASSNPSNRSSVISELPSGPRGSQISAPRSSQLAGPRFSQNRGPRSSQVSGPRYSQISGARSSQISFPNRTSRLSGTHNNRQSMMPMGPSRPSQLSGPSQCSDQSGRSGRSGMRLGVFQRRSLMTLSTLQSQLSNAELAGHLARRMSRITGGGQRPLVPAASANVEDTLSVLFFDNDVEDEERTATIPRDLYLPVMLMFFCAFNYNISYQTEWALFGVYFKEVHNWDNATFAGLAQTSGDVFGAIIINVLACLSKGRPDDEGFKAEGLKKFWHTLMCKPYWFALINFTWAVLNCAIALPHIAIAVTSQVLMGTLYIYSVQAANNMNLFFSLGDGNLFMALQGLRVHAEAMGSAIAGLLALVLYDSVDPNAAFIMTCATSTLVTIAYTVGFCRRDGYGRSLDEAEQLRADRLGIPRVKCWQTEQSEPEPEQLEPEQLETMKEEENVDQEG